MNLKPLFGRVLLRREKAEKIGSIILPDDAAKRHATLKCEVLAKGPQADETIRVGMQVIVGQYAGAWLNAAGNPVPKPDDAEYYVCLDEDIIAEVA